MSYTNEQVIEALKAVVAENGEDYVYERKTNPLEPGSACMYSNEDGTPSCIVGHIVNRLNPREFAAISDFESRTHRSTSVYNATDLGIFSFSSDQAVALSVAQSQQDNGASWGYAMERALDEFKYQETLVGQHA